MNSEEKHKSDRSGPDSPPFLLLVDDERAFADALAFRLAARDLPCTTVYRAEEALPLLERRELEVILLDLHMPGMHGLDALQIIKTRRPDVEVLLLTGAADISVAAKGMRRGAGDYLVKPVDFAVLLEALNKARQRVREHRERLRAAEAGKLMALGALAAGVGHEINNPLQIILQRSEWLQELLEDARQGRADYPEMLKSAGIIQKQAVRAGEITSHLLDLAHKSCTGSAEADAGEIARRVAAQYADRAEAGATVINLDIAPGLPLLPCSPAELEPVFGHLLRNALDAVEAAGDRAPDGAGGADGGESAPAWRARNGAAASRTRGEISINVRQQGDLLHIEVKDTGEGVPPDMEAFIFDPFFSLRPVGKGTGLGLTVCHSIVTALRGFIGHSPVPGGGALFTVDIPVAREEISS